MRKSLPILTLCVSAMILVACGKDDHVAQHSATGQNGGADSAQAAPLLDKTAFCVKSVPTLRSITETLSANYNNGDGHSWGQPIVDAEALVKQSQPNELTDELSATATAMRATREWLLANQRDDGDFTTWMLQKSDHLYKIDGHLGKVLSGCSDVTGAASDPLNSN